MEQPRLEQEIYHNYLVLDIEAGTDKDKYGIKILQNNVLGFFLPFELRSKDGTGRYYYEVPSDESLEMQLHKGIGRKQIDAFAASLLGALDEIDEYLMDVNDILLEPESIYWNGDGRYLFTYYPGYKGDVPRQLKDVAAAFLKSVDYTCSDAVRRVYEFYHMACNENSSLKNLRNFVLAGRNDYGKSSGHSRAAGQSETPGHSRAAGQSETSGHGRAAGQSETSDYGEANSGNAPPGKDAVEGFSVSRGVPKAEMIGKADEDDSLWNKAGVRWGLMTGAVCLAELGAGAVCIKVFSGIPRWLLLIAIVVVVVLTVAAACLGFMIRQKGQKSEDFWQPEDYVSYNFSPRANETTILKGKEPRITLRSMNLSLCDHLYISSFPAIIGKEVADHTCKISVPTISRRHARLEYKGNDFYLTDLHSSNGTFINGELISPMKPFQIHSGDDVIFSDLEFTFEIVEGTQ